MSKHDASRRDFLTVSGSALGASWLTLSFPSLLKAAESTWERVPGKTAFEVLSAEEAAVVEAVAAQIIPTDDTPGAREAGVVNFIDSALATFQAPSAEFLKQGVKSIETKTQELFANVNSFAGLGDEDQIAVLKSVESEGYFGFLRFLTLMGMFSHPNYGGNRNRVGWKLLGFDDRHFWQPPFGYYDANYVEGED